MKRSIVIAWILISLFALTACAEKASKDVIVTLYHGERRTDIKDVQWNSMLTKITTEDDGLHNGKIYEYEGVRIAELMKIAGAEDCSKVIVRCSDNYKVELPADDVRNYEIALVSGYASGKKIEFDAGGPVKLVYPVSDHPELKMKYESWSWAWYVEGLEFK